MTKEQFIEEAHRLSLAFAQLCWSFNTSESVDCSAEVYGSEIENATGTIITASIDFSMQQIKSKVLTDSVEPATLNFSIGQFDSAKRIYGTNYFDCKDVRKFSNLAAFATELHITEYAYGKEVKA